MGEIISENHYTIVKSFSFIFCYIYIIIISKDKNRKVCVHIFVFIPFGSHYLSLLLAYEITKAS